MFGSTSVTLTGLALVRAMAICRLGRYRCRLRADVTMLERSGISCFCLLWGEESRPPHLFPSLPARSLVMPMTGSPEPTSTKCSMLSMLAVSTPRAIPLLILVELLLI